MASLAGEHTMQLDLFAGIRVGDFAAARVWYERLLGEVSFLAHPTEAVWTLGEGRSVYIYEDADGAGGARITVFAGDLDALVATVASRGLDPVETVTYSNGVRKAIYRDADGNEVGFGGAPLARPAGSGPGREGT